MSAQHLKHIYEYADNNAKNIVHAVPTTSHEVSRVRWASL